MPILSQATDHRLTLGDELDTILAATYAQDGRALFDAKAAHYSNVISLHGMEHPTMAALMVAHPYIEGAPLEVELITEYQASNIAKLEAKIGRSWTEFTDAPSGTPATSIAQRDFVKLMKVLLAAAGYPKS